MLTSTENIDANELKLIVDSRKTHNLDTGRDSGRDSSEEPDRELFIVADTDALLYRDSLKIVQAKYKIYMHRTKAFNEGSIDGFSEVLIKRKSVLETETSSICRVLSGILHDTDVKQNNINIKQDNVDDKQNNVDDKQNNIDVKNK